MFKTFQRTLLVNYILGSGIAVFGVGGLFIFQTLELSSVESARGTDTSGLFDGRSESGRASTGV